MREWLSGINSYRPPRWLRRANSVALVILGLIFLAVAIRASVVVLLIAIVLLAGAVSNFGAEWLGWTARRNARP